MTNLASPMLFERGYCKSKEIKLDKEETAMPPDWDSKTLQGFLYSQDLSNCTTAIQFIDLLSL